MENNISPKITQLSDEQIYSEHRKEYWLKFIIGCSVALLFIICFTLIIASAGSVIDGINNIGIYKCIRRLLVFIFAVYWSIKYGRLLLKYDSDLILIKTNARKIAISGFILIVLVVSILTLSYLAFLVFRKSPNINDYAESNSNYQSSQEDYAESNNNYQSNQEGYAESNNNYQSNQEDYAESSSADLSNQEAPCPEPRCGGVDVYNVTAIASHTLENQAGNSYQVSNLLDDDETTTWATHFTGEEETLTFFMKADRLYKLSLTNGYNLNVSSFYNNSRAKDVAVYINGILDGKYELRGTEERFPEYITLSKEYNDVREVKLIISSVYKGDKWNDLCISEANFYTKE